MMNNIFHDLISEGVICIYINNILMYTKDHETHWQVTEEVLWQLQEHGLYLKHEKCEFEKTQIEYLGLIGDGSSLCETRVVLCKSLKRVTIR